MRERFHAVVSGRVQGVCFRYYTRQTAQRLELGGWVRNRDDGTVQVLAEGERERLEQLLEFLQVGPEGARVERVETDWLPYQGDLQLFSVTR